ncbi:MAG: hypothetical protein JWL62_2700 [Hyphomicrobiales bacterium]|nr:hypothetical protein [Hyphomicrobiales bacterium]
MSINLVSLVTQFLTPDMIDKIAVALGASNSTVGKALSAAVPSLLGGLAGVASTPEGSRRLLDAVDQQKAVGPESLLGMIGGAGHQGVVNNGSNLLSSLLGGTVVSSLGAALSKFAGLGGSSGTSLLGLLTPLVMGFSAGRRRQADWMHPDCRNF